EYAIDPCPIYRLTFVGAGEDPSDVVLQTRVNVTGTASFRGLTLRAPHFSNAVHMPQAGAETSFEQCIVQGDPAGKYPTIYGVGSALSLQGCEVRSVPGAQAITLRTGGRLAAWHSTLGNVSVTAGSISLSRAAAASIAAVSRSRIDADVLEVTPEPGQRSLVIQGETVCRIGRL